MTFKFKTKIKPNYGIEIGSTLTLRLSKGWIPYTVTEIDKEGKIFGTEYGRLDEEYLFSLHHVSSFLRSNELRIGFYREDESKNI